MKIFFELYALFEPSLHLGMMNTLTPAFPFWGQMLTLGIMICQNEEGILEIKELAQPLSNVHLTLSLTHSIYFDRITDWEWGFEIMSSQGQMERVIEIRIRIPIVK